MPRNKGQQETAKQIGLDDTEVVVNLQSRIEFLSEQIESLKLELSYKGSRIEELEADLRCTNEHLHSQNQENHLLAVENEQLHLTLSKVKILAQEFFLNKQPSVELLTILLSKIFGSLDESLELEYKPKKLIPQHAASRSGVLKEFSAQYSEFQTRFNELGSRFVSFKAQIMLLKSKSNPGKEEKANQHPPS